ncbi:MAG: hypothetical protein R2755_05515 [Acidimicrobiales bacterium]
MALSTETNSVSMSAREVPFSSVPVITARLPWRNATCTTSANCRDSTRISAAVRNAGSAAISRLSDWVTVRARCTDSCRRTSGSANTERTRRSSASGRCTSMRIHTAASEASNSTGANTAATACSRGRSDRATARAPWRQGGTSPD